MDDLWVRCWYGSDSGAEETSDVQQQTAKQEEKACDMYGFGEKVCGWTPSSTTWTSRRTAEQEAERNPTKRRGAEAGIGWRSQHPGAG